MSYVGKISNAPRTLTGREQALLLRVTGEHARGFRDHVIFSLSLGTGLRQHELLALNVGDVFDGGKARRRLVLQVFKRSTNKPAPQEVVLPNAVRTKLNTFYGWKRRAKQSVDADAPMFISRKGDRLSARRLRSLFQDWQKRAGFERRFRFHALRHAACSNVYARSKDIRLTQRFARHTSIVTTMIYTHPSDDDLERTVYDLPC